MVGNVSADGLNVNAAVAMPVPESVALSVGTLDATLNDAVSAPVVCGKKDTMAWQVAPTANVAVHVSSAAKEVGSAPVKEKLLSVIAAALVRRCCCPHSPKRNSNCLASE